MGLLLGGVGLLPEVPSHPRNNAVGEQGAKALGRALESNYHLRGLLLWRNRIFHSGAEALANGLAQNGTLEWLGVRVYACVC